MKRAITGIAAAALTLGAMAPAAFAATASAPSYFGSQIHVGSYNTNVQALKVQDAGNTTALFPFYYIQSGLNSIGYTVKWDGVAKRLDITTPAGVTLDTSNLDPGVGDAGIYINGTLVQRAPFQVAKDMGGNKQATSFMAAYYLDQALARIGFTNAYSGTGTGWTLTAPVLAPKVAAVKGLNATQVEVDFTQPVDSTDGAYASKYTLNGVNPQSAVVSADGKSATLTFLTYAQINLTGAAFVVSPIKTAANPAVSTATYAGTFTWSYTTAPTVTGISSVTNGATASKVTVTFSEPVTSGYASIDGVAVLGSVSGSSITFQGLSLDATKSHTLTIVNLTDAASNVGQVSQSFTINVDKVAPTVASVSAYSDSQLLVTFSKQMDSTAADAGNPTTAGNILVKDESLNTVSVGAITALAGDTTGTKFIVPITQANFYTTNTTRNLTVLFAATNADYLGNTLSTTTRTVTLKQDTTAPVVTALKYKTDTNGNVTDVLADFNKPLTVNGAVYAPTVIDNNGALQTGFLNAGSVAANGTEVDFTVPSLKQAALTGVWTFNVAANSVTDTAYSPNGNAAYSGTINFGSGTAPASTWSLTGSPVSALGGDVFTVNFGQVVKGGAVAGSATNPAMYSINGVTLPSNTVITLNPALNTATITLPAGFTSITNTNSSFRIAGIQNASGQVLNSFVQVVDVTDNTAPVLKAVHVVDSQHVVLVYSENMATVTNKTVTNEVYVKDYTGTVAGGALIANTVAGFQNEIQLSLATPLTAAQLAQPITVTTATPAADFVDEDGNVHASGTVVASN